MTKDTALHLAIDALGFTGVRDTEEYWKMMTSALQACKEALEPTVEELNDEYLRDTYVEGMPKAETQEPVALSKLLHQVIHGDFNGDNTDDLRLALNARNELLDLIHPPPSREWQSLSDYLISELWYKSQNDIEGVNLGFTTQEHFFAGLIDANLREKNNA